MDLSLPLAVRERNQPFWHFLVPPAASTAFGWSLWLLFVETVDESVLIKLLDDSGVRHVFKFQARGLGENLGDFGSDGVQPIPIWQRFPKDVELGQIVIGSFGFLDGLESDPSLLQLDYGRT